MTESRELLDELRVLGVELWAESGQLRYRAPKGVLSDDDLERIRGLKEELLAELSTELDSGPEPVDRSGSLPLSDAQQSF